MPSCQICAGDLKSVLFLGYHPPVNHYTDQIAETTVYPLELMQCVSCGLAQLGCEVDPKVVFPREYPYLSGTTKALRDNFADLAQVCGDYLLPGDLVVDIGSNDGTLLAAFDGHRRLGVEPSIAGEIARGKGIETWEAYFDDTVAEDIREKFGSAKLVTACNVFAHIPSPHKVVENIASILDEDGVFVSESHYLPSLIATLQYDTIYHEHLRYYHLGAIKTLLEPHGLEIFRVQKIPTHGGSIRVFAGKRGKRLVRSGVEAVLKNENTDLSGFARRVARSRQQLHALMGGIEGRVYGIGAPSRAATLLNYTKIDLDCILEVPGSHKLGKYMPGTKIPVLGEEKLYADQPDYALILSWHIADELMPKLRSKGYRGRFILPLPEPMIV